MADIFGLHGRHVLVTGASSGLGRHFARTLADAGGRITLAARRTQPLQESVAAIRAAGGEAGATALDVADAGSVEAALDAAEAAFGPVAVLINNAGVTETRPALEVEEDGWDRVMDTNLRGAWLMAQRTARRMVRHGTAGSIVNIASILGLRVGGGVIAYAVSKAGLVQMTKALALEWARHRIRVNALAPGWFRTEMTDGRMFGDERAEKWLKQRTPMGRGGNDDELDGALLFLASDASSFVTGQVLCVDGGWTSV